MLKECRRFYSLNYHEENRLNLLISKNKNFLNLELNKDKNNQNDQRPFINNSVFPLKGKYYFFKSHSYIL